MDIHVMNLLTQLARLMIGSGIQENKTKVERELDLIGISAMPRSLVVIGRSASLMEDNRQKLVVLQSRQPRLFIMTYDDVIDRARTNLERHLGPLSIKSNLELYFYRNDHAQAV
jgi:hypothetical protein